MRDSCENVREMSLAAEVQSSCSAHFLHPDNDIRHGIKEAAGVLGIFYFLSSGSSIFSKHPLIF